MAGTTGLGALTRLRFRSARVFGSATHSLHWFKKFFEAGVYRSYSSRARSLQVRHFDLVNGGDDGT